MSLIDELFGSGARVTSEYPEHDWDETIYHPEESHATGRAVIPPWEDGKPGYNPPSTGKVVLAVVGWAMALCGLAVVVGLVMDALGFM